MLNAGAQPVADLTSERETVGDVVVGLVKVVVVRIGRIGPEIAEDVLDVHQAHSGIVERSVVKPHQRGFLGAERFVKNVTGFPRIERGRQIHPVQAADGSDGGTDIDKDSGHFANSCFGRSEFTGLDCAFHGLVLM